MTIFRFYRNNALDFNLLRFAVAFLVIGIFWNGMSSREAWAQKRKAKEQQSEERNLFPLGTEAVVGKANLPDPLTPYQALVDEKVNAASPVKETAGCANLEVWQPVMIPQPSWMNIVMLGTYGNSEIGVIPVRSSTNCVRAGYPMRVGFPHEISGISLGLGWFYPTAIHARRPEDAAVAKLENHALLNAGIPVDEKDIVFVTGRVISHSLRGFDPLVPGVRFINRQQVEAAIANGTTIIDVRPKASFEKFRVKGSINIPYTTGPRIHFHQPYKEYPQSGDAFDIRKVGTDKQKAVVILGNFDTQAVFRAAIVLREEGWKNIYVFWEGIEYFTGMVWSPPAKSQLVRIVSGDEVARIIADKTLSAVVIDTRRSQTFAGNRILGAISVPFIERSDVRLRLPALNGEILQNYNEYLPVPKDVSGAQAIIVYDGDDQQWRGYKAALLLRSYGFKNVMWYRGGFFEWSELSLGDNRLFPTQFAPRPMGGN